MNTTTEKTVAWLPKHVGALDQLFLDTAMLVHLEVHHLKRSELDSVAFHHPDTFHRLVPPQIILTSPATLTRAAQSILSSMLTRNSGSNSASCWTISRAEKVKGKAFPEETHCLEAHWTKLLVRNFIFARWLCRLLRWRYLQYRYLVLCIFLKIGQNNFCPNPALGGLLLSDRTRREVKRDISESSLCNIQSVCIYFDHLELLYLMIQILALPEHLWLIQDQIHP